jgi:hydrogenase nickel incorporation protein HypB
MCATCGCGDTAVIETVGLVPPPMAHDHRPNGGEARRLRVAIDLLAKNDRLAAKNRAFLAEHDVLALNLVSSPGAGKTSLLERTLRDLAGRLPLAVIEGDQATSNDADRIRATGAPAIQVNTGKGCHLDAQMIGDAMARLPMPAGGILFVENVGNLVCPAGFDLGEAHKVVVASVTEGEDKPLKYPDMFAVSSLMLVSKVDLLPHLDFDLDLLIGNARRIRPDIEVIRVSARTGAGLGDWYGWLDAARPGRRCAAE